MISMTLWSLEFDSSKKTGVLVSISCFGPSSVQGEINPNAVLVVNCC